MARADPRSALGNVIVGLAGSGEPPPPPVERSSIHVANRVLMVAAAWLEGHAPHDILKRRDDFCRRSAEAVGPRFVETLWERGIR
jgi:hypothetical protein